MLQLKMVVIHSEITARYVVSTKAILYFYGMFLYTQKTWVLLVWNIFYTYI